MILEIIGFLVLLIGGGVLTWNAGGWWFAYALTNRPAHAAIVLTVIGIALIALAIYLFPFDMSFSMKRTGA